ncbi:hypothetical protein EZV62_008312 [Acer yangbiense]|uniref:RNase H type-1 domain-containing protein n=1 Tax=Acer yangbiense TaxID=1000413 RepID=A0A5C7ICS9_9ROSI|nr:hypothetical protein EZV62_008312 [Acer yangbiense]
MLGIFLWKACHNWIPTMCNLAGRGIQAEKDLVFMCVVLWRIWFWRNQIVHSSLPYRIEEVVGWASDYIGEFRKTNGLDVCISRIAEPDAGSFVKWSLPAEGCYKINYDAAIWDASQLVGVGTIVRDSCGRVMVSTLYYVEDCCLLF